MHFLKKKQNKTKQDVLQTCIRGDRRNWENSVDQETESKCLLTTEHEHLLIKKTFLLAPPNEKKKADLLENSLYDNGKIDLLL